MSESANEHRKRIGEFLDIRYIASQLADHGMSDEKIEAEYLSGALPDVEPNALFDPNYYRAQLGGAAIDGVSLIEHFVTVGVSQRLQPSALFDIAFYLRQYPDVLQSGVNPLSHFLKMGRFEGRLPASLQALSLLGDDNAVFAAEPNHVVRRDIRWLLLLYHGKTALLRTEIDKAASDSASAMPLLLSGCIVLEAEARYLDAVSGYELLSQVWPEQPVVPFKLGVLLRNHGRLELGLHYLKVAEGAAPTADYISTAAGTLSKHIERAHSELSRAEVLFEEGKLEEARALAQNAGIGCWFDNRRTERLGLEKLERPSSRILLFDTSFPDTISSFRFGEFSCYIENIPNADIVSSTWDLRQFGGSSDFASLVSDYCAIHGVEPQRVQAFDAQRDLSCDLVYSVFLNNAVLTANASIVPARRIAFTLYPGGGFILEDHASDSKIQRICNDPRFGKVITTQSTTYNYLVDRGLCDPEFILHLYGGIVPACLNVGEPPSRLLEERMKKPLKVCFVAQRYSEQGVEKGYDVFVEVAAGFRNRSDLEFHVVGGFNEAVLPISGANIVFHGVQKHSFFPSFYADMDVIISPNISGYELDGTAGSFDGFPTTACVEAGVQGVAMFLADSLGMNWNIDGTTHFEPGVEFELIERDSHFIVSLLDRYLGDRPSLAALGMRGREALLMKFSFAQQLQPRIEMLRSFVTA